MLREEETAELYIMETYNKKLSSTSEWKHYNIALYLCHIWNVLQQSVTAKDGTITVQIN